MNATTLNETLIREYQSGVWTIREYRTDRGFMVHATHQLAWIDSGWIRPSSMRGYGRTLTGAYEDAGMERDVFEVA